MMRGRLLIPVTSALAVVLIGCSPSVDLTKEERAVGSACASDPPFSVEQTQESPPFRQVVDSFALPASGGATSLAIDGDQLWVLVRGQDGTNDALIALDPAGAVVREWPLTGWPWMLHIADGFAATMNLRNDTPMRIDLATGTQTSARGVAGDPQNFAVSPDGRRAYQPLALETAISVTDLVSGEQVCVIPVVSGTRSALALSRDGVRVFVGYGGGGGSSYHAGIELLDRATGETLTLLPLTTDVTVLSLSPDESTLIGIGGAGRELVLIDPVDVTEIGRVTLPGEASGLTWHEGVAYVWSYAEQVLWAVDVDDQEVVATIDLPSRPQDVIFAGDRGYVAGDDIHVLGR